MANVFQPTMPPGTRLSGTGNVFQGLQPVGEAIGQGLLMRQQRRMQGQQLLAQLFQMDPEIAAATVRGMGTNGLVAMGVPPEEAEQLFAQVQGTVEERPAAGGVGMESVQQPGMLRPRTALEEAQIQQAQQGARLTGAQVGKTEAETVTEGVKPGLLGAQEEATRAEAELTRKKFPQVEAYTRLLGAQGDTEQIRGQLMSLNMPLLRQQAERGRIENATARETAVNLFVQGDSYAPLNPGQKATLRRVLANDEPLPSWAHMLTPGEASVMAMAQEQGIEFDDAQEIRRLSTNLDMDIKFYQALAAEKEPERIEAQMGYMDALAEQARAEKDRAGQPGGPTATQQAQLLKQYLETHQDWKGTFITQHPHKTGKLRAGGAIVRFRESPALNKLMLLGNPDPEAVRRDLAEFIATTFKGKKADDPRILEGLTYEFTDEKNVDRAFKGEELINAISNARRKGQAVFQLGAMIGLMDEPLLPTEGDTEQSERMQMFREGLLGGLDDEIENIREQLQQSGD